MTDFVEWRGDKICSHYYDMVEAQFLAGKISQYKKTRELNQHRLTYLPEQPRACFLDADMWAKNRHGATVCVGCGLLVGLQL